MAGLKNIYRMISQKTLKLYVYVDGVNDIPFYGSSSGEFEEFILANGETFVTKDGYVFNVRTMSEQIEIGSFRYDAQRMGGVPTLTFTLMYEDCLDNLWSDNVYAVFNNERHFLKMTPTSSKTNDDTRYKHEVELVAERKILDDTYFYDAVVGDPQENDKPVTNDTELNFYGNIADFAKRMNASLQYTKLQKVNEEGLVIDGYYVVIDEGIKTEDKQLAFDGAVFSQALQESYNTFGIPFYFVGKEIHLGFTNNAIADVLEYGVDDALLSITKQNANFKVVNRATGKGSTDNIPYYYPNNAPKGEIEAVVNTTSDDFEVKVEDMETYSSKIGIDESLEYKKATVTIPKNEDSKEIDFRYTTTHTSKFNLSVTSDSYAKTKIVFSPVVNLNQYTWYKYGGETIMKFEKKAEPKITATFYLNSSQIDQRVLDGDDIILDIDLPIGTSVIRVNLFFEMDSKLTTKLFIGDASITANLSSSEGSSWFRDNRSVELSDVGLSGKGTPEIGDTITQRLIHYTKSSTNLQPSIYRATKGAERFYNAINYPFDYVEGYELQYGEYVGEDNKVHNDLYKKDDGSYIVFANPYVEGNPKEHVFSVDDIKPTIKEMTNSVVWQEEDEETGEMVNVYQRIDVFSEFAYDENDNDETYTDKDNNIAFKHPYFFAKLRKLDFNLFDCAIESEPMTISFTSGNCGACKFTVGVSEEYPTMNPVQVDENGNLVRDEEGRVLCGLEDFQPLVQPQDEQQDTINHEVWIALKKEEDTYGILMPKAPKYDGDTLVEAGHRPKGATWDESKGVYLNDADTFVILGIKLPDEYILSAERKLEKKIIDYIVENNNEKFNFSINFSRIFLEENPNFLAQLNENARLNVRYNDKVYLLYVSSFSYNMGEGDILPEISVELDDTLTIAQNALQNAIDSVRSEIGQAVNSLDMVALGGRLFLRKDVDDVAEGVIDFRNGVVFGEGGDVSVYPDGSAKLSIDYLEVTKKATFTSLEIQERSNVGGQLLITPAAMVCNGVDELDNAYRCYFQTDGDEGEEIFNTFAMDDQAICQTFNTWGSRFYWRLVVGVGDNYIDLSKTDCAPESDIPTIGDKIVQLGNRTNTGRQAAQVLSSHGENAPSFVMYNGIDSFSIEDKEVTGIAWNPENQEPEMYSYGSFYFGDKAKESNYIAFDKKEDEDAKTLRVRANVTIEEGSIMTSRLDVGETEEGDIEAFFNGGDFAKDTSERNCGKLILAAGIPTVEESGLATLEERASVATTRIYEDGCTYTKNLHLQEGCTIGTLKIDKEGIGINGCDDEGYSTAINIYRNVISMSQTYNDGYSCSYKRMLRMDNSDNAEAYITIDENRRVDAIRVTKGTFGGLRPKTTYRDNLERYSDGYRLGVYDFNVFFPATAETHNVYLPDEPEDGQEYWIETAGANINIISNTRPIWVHYTNSKMYVLTHLSRGIVRFKFYEDALVLGESNEFGGIWSASIIESRTD